jgi:hypothetical protein
MTLACVLHTLFQFGVVGYDQWQVSYNRGTTPLGLPARLVPFYSVRAVGLQSNLIVPAKGLTFTFKYESEYSAKAHQQGRTLVFSGVWNLRFPKEQAQSPSHRRQYVHSASRQAKVVDGELQ